MGFTDCEMCGKPYSVSYMVGKIWICERCHMKLEPPKVTISVSKRTPLREIHSLTSGNLDPIISIADLSKCGWFFRSARVESERVVIEAEFHGDKRCPRVREYYGYPIGFENCSNRVCIKGGFLV